MLPQTEDEVRQYCIDLHLPEHAVRLLWSIVSSPPMRNVRSGRDNVTAYFPSQKDGVSIQAESRTIELAFVHEYEYDEDVRGFLDQPYTMTLRYAAKSGKRVGVQHTPDFLVFRENAAGFEECKDEKDLFKLAGDMPNRYVRGTDGVWRCPPGEEWAAQFGLYYRIRSSEEINLTRYRNLIFLRDYLDDDCPPPTQEVADAIMAHVGLNPGITLKKLIDTFTDSGSDDIYKLISQQVIFVDLDMFPLAEAQYARVFRDEITCQGYSVAVSMRASFERPELINHWC